MNFDLRLSAAGLQHFPPDPPEAKFDFIVGHYRYPSNWITATFLSPKIASLLTTDRSLAQYVIETPDPDSSFPLLLQLGSGSTVALNPQHARFLLSVSRELGNSELYLALLTHFQPDLILTDALSRLPSSDFLDFGSDHSIPYLASHFSDLSPEVRNEIPFPALYQIVSHPSLRVSSEDSLCDFLFERIADNPDFFDLFQFVHFTYLTASTLRQFVDLSVDNFDRFGPSLWASVVDRLLLPVVGTAPDPRYPSRDFLKSLGKGIISYLTEQCHGNVHDMGVVTITAKSIDSGFPVRNIADLDSQDVFRSLNEPGQWLCWDFGKRRVRITDYQILFSGYWEIRTVAVEGSVDGVEWTALGGRKGNEWVFAGKVEQQVDCRYIRVNYTPDEPGHDAMCVASFEVFGTLLEYDD
jgi:hypothetical protein